MFLKNNNFCIIGGDLLNREASHIVSGFERNAKERIIILLTEFTEYKKIFWKLCTYIMDIIMDHATG